DGAPLAARHTSTVHVRGGVGATRVDLDELRGIESRLEDLLQHISRVELALSIGRHDLSMEAVLAPGPAAAAEDAIVTALDGGWGTRRLQEEAFALLMSVRYARVLYEEAELAVHALTPAPSWVEFVLVTLSQPGYTTSSLLAVARKLL